MISLLVGWVIYSRMYIGAHFLSDCLAGVLVGLLVGYLVYRIYLALRRRLLATGYRDPREIFHEGTVYFVCALWVSIPVTLMMALQVTRILRMVVE